MELAGFLLVMLSAQAWGQTGITLTEAHWTSGDCMACHTIDQPIFSHPVDVRPSMAVPEGLPLTYGKVTCTTCHQDTASAHAASRQNRDGFLRAGMLPGAASCAQCHSPDSRTAADIHALALGVAHPQWNRRLDLSSMPTTAMSLSQLLAGTSTTSHLNTSAKLTFDCRGCHDGSMAQDLGPSHVVDVPYRRQRTGRGISQLVPAAQLDSRIRLFDGKMQCNSCHSAYAGNEKLLVMSNIQGQLCRSCHDMDH